MEKDKGASIHLQLRLELITCSKMQLELLQREDSAFPEIESSCHRYQRMEAIIEAEKALSFSQGPRYISYQWSVDQSWHLISAM